MTENTKNTYHFNLIVFLFSLISFLFSQNLNSQDSIPAKKDLTEEAELKFQEFFFKALSEKAIGNHQKAIENLESCNQILPENTAVFFEFSKNYLELNNLLLAKEYINRALQKEVDNLWMLKHLVEICQKENNLTTAIEIQQKIVKSHPKERQFLVQLYIFNKDDEKAMSLLKELEQEQAMTSFLKKLKNGLDQKSENIPEKQEVVNKDLDFYVGAYNDKKTFKELQEIFKNTDNVDILLKYSNEGIALFPAQPLVYLVNGKALNEKKEFNKALSILQSGIDFVIDDVMEAEFYKEIATSFKGLGNSNEEKKYIEKAKKIKI